MKNRAIDTNNLSREEYWRLFGRVIVSADIGAFAACLGWILYWFDHIPDHIIHLHGITPFLFLASLSAALYAGVITVKTGNKMGARGDRSWHLFEIFYALFASISGIIAYLAIPPF